MSSLLRYLLRNYAFVLFVLLEAISITMVINYNSYHKAKYLNSANSLAGNIYNVVSSVKYYFNLSRVNKQLARENSRLRVMLDRESGNYTIGDSVLIDTIKYLSTYNYTSARVINNSTNHPYNYITLNKGSKDGIRPDMGIISGDGIVGVITNVSGSYSVGFSVLNQRWSVSAKHKKSEYFGSLSWKGNNYRTASLNEIPFHIDISAGDTIVTSGYSSIFPEGIMIGTIRNYYRSEGENYYDIDITLSTDFKKLFYVEVIDNVNIKEVKELEKAITDGK